MNAVLPCPLARRRPLPFWPGARPCARVYDNWRLRDGAIVRLRPARAQDAYLIQDLMHRLSTQSRYRRFFYPLHELPPDLLERFTRAEPARAMNLLATVVLDGKESVIGMAQYVADDYPRQCDFAVVVADDHQRNGIATRLTCALMDVARAAGIARIQGDVLLENAPMRAMMEGLGFRLERHPEDTMLRRASRQLAPAGADAPPAA